MFARMVKKCFDCKRYNDNSTYHFELSSPLLIANKHKQKKINVLKLNILIVCVFVDTGEYNKKIHRIYTGKTMNHFSYVCHCF